MLKYLNTLYEIYKGNTHSQNGEDGVLEEILKRLDIKTGWVCEFGAWDGVYLSNTFKLIQRGFNAVLIEGDAERFNGLNHTAISYPGILPINAYVSPDRTSPNAIDNLLHNTPIPQRFDVLSIDVDSCDYQIWRSLLDYEPSVVIIEINSSVHPENPRHIHEAGKYQGTGFLPTLTLGNQKGYTFVLHTGNMIFVRKDLYARLGVNYADPVENFRRDFM